MNVYFTASTANLQINKQRYLAIIKILEKLGNRVEESWLLEKLSGKVTSKLSSKELLLKNLQLLHEANFAVMEISTPSFGVGYFIGQAIAQRKRVLCLYPEEMQEAELSEIVTGSTSSLLTHSKYNDQNLEQVIRDFQASMKMDELRKFNFIATDEIIDYIEKGATKENKSKSEFLRDKIMQELMS